MNFTLQRGPAASYIVCVSADKRSNAAGPIRTKQHMEYDFPILFVMAFCAFICSTARRALNEYKTQCRSPPAQASHDSSVKHK